VSTLDQELELFVSSITLPQSVVPTIPLQGGKEDWLVYIDTSASTGNSFLNVVFQKKKIKILKNDCVILLFS